jgi:hypothetical protein
MQLEQQLEEQLLVRQLELRLERQLELARWQRLTAPKRQGRKAATKMAP